MIRLRCVVWRDGGGKNGIKRVPRFARNDNQKGKGKSRGFEAEEFPQVATYTGNSLEVSASLVLKAMRS